jgi:hypothetical protein
VLVGVAFVIFEGKKREVKKKRKKKSMRVFYQG